jgi:hypothetical protein
LNISQMCSVQRVATTPLRDWAVLRSCFSRQQGGAGKGCFTTPSENPCTRRKKRGDSGVTRCFGQSFDAITCYVTPDPKIAPFNPSTMISTRALNLWGKATFYAKTKSRIIMCGYKECGCNPLEGSVCLTFAYRSHVFKIL